MFTFVLIIHVVVCIALILVVLLQTGKGADMGAVFGGGGSQTLFGPTGASTFLGKATAIAAVVFMLTSLILAYSAGQRPTASIMSGTQRPAHSVPQAAPAPGTKSAPAHKTNTPAQPAAKQPTGQNDTSNAQTKTPGGQTGQKPNSQ